jgi:hypothetical protein
MDIMVVLKASAVSFENSSNSRDDSHVVPLRAQQANRAAQTAYFADHKSANKSAMSLLPVRKVPIQLPLTAGLHGIYVRFDGRIDVGSAVVAHGVERVLTRDAAAIVELCLSS